MLADQGGHDLRALELLHKVADGSADAHEREEWGRLIADKPELRSEFEAIRMVVQQMDAHPLVEAPASLKSDILNLLRQRHLAPAAPLANSAVRMQPSPKRWKRPALAWAAGIALIVGSAYFLDRHDPFDSHRVHSSEVSGSMGARDPRSWRVVENNDPVAPGTDLSLVLRREGDRFAVEALSNGGGNLEPAELRWDIRTLECVAVVPPGENIDALNGSGSVRLSHVKESGPGPLHPLVVFRFRAEFNNPQEVILMAGGREYHRATISMK